MIHEYRNTFILKIFYYSKLALIRRTIYDVVDGDIEIHYQGQTVQKSEVINK